MWVVLRYVCEFGFYIPFLCALCSRKGVQFVDGIAEFVVSADVCWDPVL